MTKYVKFISETQIEFPPVNKGNIINYNLSEDLLLADGYKPFVEAEREAGHYYDVTYEETEDTVEEVLTDITSETNEQKFLENFFYVVGYGYYRKQPKGYKSAVESMNVLFNYVLTTNGIPEGIIIFYQQPDFSDSSQCTEEWLAEHQIMMPAMTKEQFLQLWGVFTQSWNNQEHVNMNNEELEESLENES